MKKICIKCIICLVIFALIYDYVFLGVNINIKELYIAENALGSVNNYDIINEYSTAVMLPTDAKTIYITLEISNKSFLKSYKNLKLSLEEQDDIFPFVGKSFDMGGESGIIQHLHPRQIRMQYNITALVNKNIEDKEIFRLLSNKHVSITGTIFGVNNKVSNSIAIDANN